MSLLRCFVTVVVALPLFLVVGWPHPWETTFLISLGAVSAGYAVEVLVKRREQTADSRAAEVAPPDGGEN
jgi:hypothetical protein